MLFLRNITFPTRYKTFRSIRRPAAAGTARAAERLTLFAGARVRASKARETVIPSHWATYSILWRATRSARRPTPLAHATYSNERVASCDDSMHLRLCARVVER